MLYYSKLIPFSPTFMSEPSALMPLEAPRRTAIASYARSS